MVGGTGLEPATSGVKARLDCFRQYFRCLIQTLAAVNAVSVPVAIANGTASVLERC